VSCNPIAYFYTEDCVCGFSITILKKEKRKQAKSDARKTGEPCQLALTASRKLSKNLNLLITYRQQISEVNTVLTQFLAEFQYGINIQTKVLESLE
jgi:hypothetical protein